jgi:hypothetical protein
MKTIDRSWKWLEKYVCDRTANPSFIGLGLDFFMMPIIIYYSLFKLKEKDLEE